MINVEVPDFAISLVTYLSLKMSTINSNKARVLITDCAMKKVKALLKDKPDSLNILVEIDTIHPLQCSIYMYIDVGTSADKTGQL